MDSNTPPGQHQHDPVPTSAPASRVWRDRFQSRNADETQAYFGGRFGERSRVPRMRGDFFYGHVVAGSDRLALGTVKTLMPQTLRTTVREPTLYLPLRGEDQYQVGRRTVVSDPRTAMLLAPGCDYTCHSQANDWVGMTLSSELLAEELAARRGSASRTYRFRTAALHIAPARTAELLAFRRRMHALSRAGAPVDEVAGVERDAAAWLAAIILEQRGEVRLAGRTLQRIEQLERWIDAHLGEQITLERLCSVSGICARVLQKSVLALRGQTPVEWVRSRRLTAVRARLVTGAPRTSISQVALDFGFTHLGRFSALYREAYGELPSATLGEAQAASRRGLQPGRPA